MAVAEKVYNNRETIEERQLKVMNIATEKQARTMAKILLATTSVNSKEKHRQLRQLVADRRKRCILGEKTRLLRNQCAYWKKMGHWTRNCLEKPLAEGRKADRIRILDFNELSN